MLSARFTKAFNQGWAGGIQEDDANIEILNLGDRERKVLEIGGRVSGINADGNFSGKFLLL